MLPGTIPGEDDFVIPVVQRRTSFLIMLRRLAYPRLPRFPSFRVSVAFQRARSATTRAPASLTWLSQQLESLRKRESALCVRFPTRPASLSLWHTASCLVPVTRSCEGGERLELNQHLYCGSRGGQRTMAAVAPPHLVLSVTALFTPRSHGCRSLPAVTIARSGY